MKNKRPRMNECKKIIRIPKQLHNAFINYAHFTKLKLIVCVFFLMQTRTSVQALHARMVVSVLTRSMATSASVCLVSLAFIAKPVSLLKEQNKKNSLNSPAISSQHRTAITYSTIKISLEANDQYEYYARKNLIVFNIFIFLQMRVIVYFCILKNNISSTHWTFAPLSSLQKHQSLVLLCRLCRDVPFIFPCEEMLYEHHRVIKYKMHKYMHDTS